MHAKGVELWLPRVAIGAEIFFGVLAYGQKVSFTIIILPFMTLK